MRVLVTRPREDSEMIAKRLAELGHEPIIAPLLDVRFLDGPPLALAGVNAILATSANGIRALARRTERRDLPVFAVGPQTAAESVRLGFGRVKSANGDAAALAKAVASWAKPGEGRMFHATGADAEGRLAADLSARGFDVETSALYEVAAASVLPTNAASALEGGLIDAALFFSPRSARVFRERLQEAGLSRLTAPLVAISISGATADALKPLIFRENRIASSPNQDALFDCLG